MKFGAPANIEVYNQLFDELLSFAGTSRKDHILEEARVQREGAPENAPAASEISGMDPDLIHLPFLRLSALGDVGALSEMAEQYIEAYPQSYIGYMYLAEAAWKSGDQAAAVNILRKGLGTETTDEAVLELLGRWQSRKPIEVIMDMNL